MDSKQDHNTALESASASGVHGSHGAAIHLCNKCGWPFPNPHPSAKQRRAHKKLCGTIQSYTLDMDANRTLSDDDLPQTPSPKHVEKSDCEKTSGVGEKSNRSEDEVFADAVMEFSDSGFSPQIDELATAAKIEVQISGEKDLTVFHSFKDNAYADFDETSSCSNVSNLIQNPEVPENATTLLGSNLVSRVHFSSTNGESGGDVSEGLVTFVGQEKDATGCDKIDPDANTIPFLVSEYPGQSSEAESECPETKKITTDPLPADEVVLSKEEHGADMDFNMHLGGLMPDVDSVKLSDAAENNVGAAQQGLNLSSVNLNEGLSEMEEGNKDVYELSVPEDFAVVDGAETMLEGFKDHKRMKLHQPMTLESCEIIEYVKGGIDDCSNDISKMSAKDMHAVDDSFIHKTNMPVVNIPSSREENDESQVVVTSKGPDELLVYAAAETVGLEKSKTISSIKQQEYHDVSNAVMALPETAPSGLYDGNPIVSPLVGNMIALDDSVSHEYSTTEVCDVSEKDKKDNGDDWNVSQAIVTTSESITDLPLCQVDPATSVSRSDGAVEHEVGKIEKHDGVEVVSREETLVEKLVVESKTVSESDNNLLELQVVADDVRDASMITLSESKVTNVGGVLDTLDVPEQLNGNDKAQGEYDAKDGRDIDAMEKTSVDHATKAHLLSSSDAESSMQGAAAVDDVDYATDSCINQSSQGGDGNNFGKHKLGASAIDVSVDSFSQTDSLEGNWGSISVISNQSEVPAAIDESLLATDNLASAEAEKLNLKTGATESEHSGKSDVFEAPSFMTLVRPGSGRDEKVTASNTETVHNVHQQKAPSEAGWFPSLTHVVNDSQGRKKNEEIIAKVTNWSTGKHRTPLKNLLSEADLETKPKSPKTKETTAPVIEKIETTMKDNGGVPMTVSAILGPEHPELGKRETEKEVNYPVEIKSEKRKVKGRSFWVQLLCCSSVK